MGMLPTISRYITYYIMLLLFCDCHSFVGPWSSLNCWLALLVELKNGYILLSASFSTLSNEDDAFVLWYTKKWKRVAAGLSTLHTLYLRITRGGGRNKWSVWSRRVEGEERKWGGSGFKNQLTGGAFFLGLPRTVSTAAEKKCTCLLISELGAC